MLNACINLFRLFTSSSNTSFSVTANLLSITRESLPNQVVCVSSPLLYELPKENCWYLASLVGFDFLGSLFI